MDDSTRIRADIIPYSPEYSGVVRSWIDSEDTYFHLCRGKDFPPPDDIVDSWQRESVSSYILMAERKPVAYGELWERKMERSVEVAHLIVDPYKRRRGYGTKMLNLLFEQAASRKNVTKVVINLYTESREALGCYMAAGFELVGTATHVQGLQMLRIVPPRR